MRTSITGQRARWKLGHAGCPHAAHSRISTQNLNLKHSYHRQQHWLAYGTLPDPITPSIACGSHTTWGASELTTTEWQDDNSTRQPLNDVPSTPAHCKISSDITSHQAVSAFNINKQFVKSLRNVTTMQQLEACIHDMNADEFDHQSVTAIGTRLKKLAFPYQPAGYACQPTSTEQASRARIALSQAQRFAGQTWMPLVHSRLHAMDPAGLCVCFQAAIHLKLLSPDILEPIMMAWMPCMHTSSPRIQTTMLWCAAQAGFPPPNPWLRTLSAASLRRLSEYSLHDLSQALWSFARLQWQPPTSWTQHMLIALSKLVSPSCESSQTCIIPQQHEHAPSGHQQSSCEPQSNDTHQDQPELQPQTPQCDRQSVLLQGSNQGTSYADLDPTQQTVDDQLQKQVVSRNSSLNLQEQSLQRTNSFHSVPMSGTSRPEDTLQSLSMAMWSLPRLGIVPSPELTDAMLTTAATAMQVSITVTQRHRRHQKTVLGAIAMMSHGLLALQHQPSPCFLKVFLQTTQLCMEAGTSRELVIVGMAVVNWKLTPSTAWMMQYETCSAACLQHCTDQGLVILLDVFAQLSYRPHETWMHQYQACLTGMLPRVIPTAAAQLLSCFGALQYRPNIALGTQLWLTVAQHGRFVPAKRWFPALLAASLLGLAPFAAAGTSKNVSMLSQTADIAPTAGSRQDNDFLQSTGQHDNFHASVDQLLSVCADKLIHCQPSNLSHMVWACVAWSESSRENSSGDETKLAMQDSERRSNTQSSSYRQRPALERWHVPQSFLHSLFCATRQKLHVAQPSEVASLLKGLAVLESYSRGKVGSTSKIPGLKHLLLEACVACLQSFDLHQLMGILQDAVLLGASCAAGNAEPIKEASYDDDSQRVSYDSSKAMQQLCNACCKLALEHGQRTATMSDPRVDAFNSNCLQSLHSRVRTRRGLRSSILEIAAVRHCNDLSSYNRELPLVLCAWQRLNAAEFFICMPLNKRQQFCLALCTAIEQEVEQWKAGAWVHETRSLVQSICQGMGVSVHSTFLHDFEFPFMLA